MNELAVRREKGLCYNCDKKFVPGHCCKKQGLFYLHCDMENVEDEEIFDLLMAATDKPGEELAKSQTGLVYALSGIYIMARQFY